MQNQLVVQVFSKLYPKTPYKSNRATRPLSQQLQQSPLLPLLLVWLHIIAQCYIMQIIIGGVVLKLTLVQP